MSKKKSTNSESRKTKKPTIEQYLFSLDEANKNLDHKLSSMLRLVDSNYTDLRGDVQTLRNEISRLNEMLYEDRLVLAKFVKKFFKDTDTFIDPKMGIDGGKKAKK